MTRMLDSTIHAATIARQIRKSDFESNVWSLSPCDKDDVISEALSIAKSGFGNISLRIRPTGNKPVYQQSHLPEILLVRHASETIRRITSVRQSDRQSIIKSLRCLVSEGAAFNVSKFDIRSFYESIDPNLIIESLRQDAVFPRQVVDVITKLFSSLNARGIQGLPRGIGLSATLSEYLMRPFDRQVAGAPGVRFYQRFVDDIIMVSSEYSNPESLNDLAASLLPPGLAFGRQKSVTLNFSRNFHGQQGVPEGSFTYLGYKFDVHPIERDRNSWKRRVDLDIDPKKVAKIKKRISLSLLQFQNDRKFADLSDRLKFLTSNTSFVDTSTGQKRLTGLRYNYGQINASSSKALKELDKFLRNSICSPHRNNRLKPVISSRRRNMLLGLTFSAGFTENRFFSFDGDRLKKLARCWSHA